MHSDSKSYHNPLTGFSYMCYYFGDMTLGLGVYEPLLTWNSPHLLRQSALDDREGGHKLSPVMSPGVGLEATKGHVRFLLPIHIQECSISRTKNEQLIWYLLFFCNLIQFVVAFFFFKT